VYPPSKSFAKLVHKNAIKHQKGVPSPKNFHSPYLMDPPLDFQTVCICDSKRTSVEISKKV
jgi:hypothetical protein